MSPPASLPVPGDLVDTFLIEEAIGVGGMGAVFRALDTKLDRQVALKLLPPDQAGDSEIVPRFYQEGRSAAQLDHENIARVYSIGQDGPYHYIAFEYIEGVTVRQKVETSGALAVAEAVNITLQIAHALVHASMRGVVHRDIKPSNIIITPGGQGQAGRHGAGAAVRARGRSRAHPERHDAGHVRLHQPRASARPARRRCAQRSLFARMHAISHAYRPSAVSGRDGPAEADPAPGRSARRRADAQSGRSRRAGRHHRQADGQGP